MKIRILAAAFAGSMLFAPAAFANSYPIVFVSKNHVFKGENFDTQHGGKFTVSDGRVSCSSSHYDWDSDATALRVHFACSNGLKGVTHSSRAPDPDEQVLYSSGGGTFKMSDGGKGAFYWGDAAEAYR